MRHIRRQKLTPEETGSSVGTSSLVEQLVRAGTATDEEIDSLVEQSGLDAVVRSLVDEIIYRSDTPMNLMPVNVALDIVHRDARRRVVLRVQRDKPIQSLDERNPVVWSELSMSVTSLLRRLYGRTGHPRTGD